VNGKKRTREERERQLIISFKKNNEDKNKTTKRI